MINYGIVYPQAILIFVITLLYSVIQPLILVFGAVYFGVAYVVYKYKLLFGTFNRIYNCSASDLRLQCSTSRMNRKVKPGRSPSCDSSGAFSCSSFS